MVIGSSLSSQERRQKLLALLDANGELRIEQVASSLDVSSMTIRRDLGELEDEGLLRRVRGGAVPVVTARPFEQRQAVRAGAKSIIAQKALSLIPMRGVIAFDASSTITTLAEAMGPREDLTVLTNSAPTAEALDRLAGVTALLTGGQREPSTGSLVGELATRNAADFHTEMFFASTGGVDASAGCTEVSLAEAQVKKVFAAHARRTVLCADSSKLEQVSVAKSLALDEVSMLVTELDPGDSRLDGSRGLVEFI
ncbi:DeoR/GlpR transcriptional regulator [Brevibacterium permense]|uniref:DeoR/GlpR family DNA-binding transcription regulator n=1 Tax=Brevibacterium permense TaxID=234834 RepID=UPI0021CEA68F|nr:DeoR/GlpR family DNA-binding transcription regulator [Brevibacterium permense]MCU4295594.1 DeoR/GlpR transcriptional regulator [Brevibacterium permense]